MSDVVMSETLLRCEKLGKRFALPGRMEFWAVRDIDLQIRRGEALGIVGESGSGKSTLGRLLIGLHDKTEGDVFYCGNQEGYCGNQKSGRDVRLPRVYRRADFRRWAAHMQMVFQDPYATLNPRFTVGASIAEPLLLSTTKKIDGSRAGAPLAVPLNTASLDTMLLNTAPLNIEQRVAHALERVGLTAAMAQRYPHEFSGGQRQRIGLARALITEPEILICDEPVSALDVSVQAQIINLLARLRREMNLTLVFISHDLAVVRHLCDRVAVMQSGRIVELAETEQLFAAPQHEFTRRLLAARNILP